MSKKQGNKGKLPKETTIDRPLVGKTPTFSIFKRAWQPHLYRLYFQFNKHTFKPPNRPTTDPPQIQGGWFNNFRYKTINHNKEHLFMNFNYCNILVKQNQVMVQNKRMGQQWYYIEYNNPDVFMDFLRDKCKEFDKYALQTLKLFVMYYGGKTDYKILKRPANENGLIGDEYIDRLPRHLRVHTDLVKKDYAEKLEFKGIEPAIAYVHNRAYEMIAPDIKEDLSQIKAKLDTFSNDRQLYHSDLEKLRTEAIVPLTHQIKLHLTVEKRKLKLNKKMGSTLTEQTEIFKNIKNSMQKDKLYELKKDYRENFGHEWW